MEREKSEREMKGERIPDPRTEALEILIHVGHLFCPHIPLVLLSHPITFASVSGSHNTGLAPSLAATTHNWSGAWHQPTHSRVHGSCGAEETQPGSYVTFPCTPDSQSLSWRQATTQSDLAHCHQDWVSLVTSQSPLGAQGS